MLDMGDLSWNQEMQLMCPNNPIGMVDLFMVGNHGSDVSSSPALVNGLHPRLIVMDNGARKFGAASVMQALKAAPGLLVQCPRINWTGPFHGFGGADDRFSSSASAGHKKRWPAPLSSCFLDTTLAPSGAAGRACPAPT